MTVIGFWFFLNMFIGVLFTTFQSFRIKKEKNQNLSVDQLRWVQIQNKILYEKPYKIFIPKTGIKLKIRNFLESIFFKSILKFAYFLNLIIVLINFNVSNDNTPSFVYYSIIALSFIYVFEISLRIIVYGVIPYFTSGYFFFHLIFPLGFFFHFLIFAKYLKFNISAQNTFKLIRFTKIFLVFGVIKLIFQHSKILKNIMNILSLSFNLIFDISAIFLMTLFLYSLIGCKIFGKAKQENSLNEYINFENIFQAMLTLYKVVTSDSAGSIMFDFRNDFPSINF